MNIQLYKNSTKVFPVPYYPVGSVYISYTDVSPASMFGGTWEPITDRFLYGGTVSGTLGGESTHTLVVDELPAHTHKVYGRSGTGTGTSRVVIDSFILSTSRVNSVSLNQSGCQDLPHNNMPPYMAVYMWRRIEDTSTIATLDSAILDSAILG
jgi:hypothetical protein